MNSKLEKIYILSELFEEIGFYSYDDTYDLYGYVDHSDYTTVDGEEGDYGVVKYYNSDKHLIAARQDFGGDLCEWIYEDNLKSIAKRVIFEYLSRKIDEL